jgi:hypothetical protein
MTYLRPGDRVRICRDVDRFPDFVAPVGAVGVVVEADGFAVALDEPPAGAEAWDGVVYWYPDVHGSAWMDEVAPDTCNERINP